MGTFPEFAKPDHWSRLRRGPAAVMSLAFTTSIAFLLAPLLLLGSPARAHMDPISFAWVSPTGAVEARHSPDPLYSQNEYGGGIVSDRQSAGVYRVRFYGMGANANGFGHVQVSAYGTQPTWCQIRNWTGDDLFVVCFDAAGSPTDSAFTVMRIDEEEWHTVSYGWLWSSDASSATSTANPSYSTTHGFPATYTINRVATGLYDVVFPASFLSFRETEFSVQVSAYGPAPARCKLDGYDEDNVRVRCQDASGQSLDSRFNLLAITANTAEGTSLDWLEGVAYARVHDGLASSGTPVADRASSAGGGPIDWIRWTPGEYRVTWDGYEDFGVNGGTVQVTADSSGDAWCKIASWSNKSATVHCFDATGLPVDTPFNVFHHKTPRRTFNQEYAWGAAVAPTMPAYTVLATHQYNAGGLTSAVWFTRAGLGTYAAEFPGMADIGSDGGVVLVTMSDEETGHCKPVSWTDELADVRCYDQAGSLADRAYNVLYWKPTDGSEGVAYAWGNLPSETSYEPWQQYAHNPTGGTTTIDRVGTGHYEVTWAGYGATIQWEGQFTGHPQVSAYGTTNHRCNTGSMHVSGDMIEVHCFDASGNPVDTEFVVLYVKANRFWQGIHYGWGHLPSTSFYAQLGHYSTSSDLFEIDLSRMATGDYSLFLQTFMYVTLGNALPHVQVSARESTSVRCAPRDSFVFYPIYSEDIDCWNQAGLPVDARYDVLMLTPHKVPEPSLGVGFAAGLLGLTSLARRRVRRVGRAAASDCGAAEGCECDR